MFRIQNKMEESFMVWRDTKRRKMNVWLFVEERNGKRVRV